MAVKVETPAKRPAGIAAAVILFVLAGGAGCVNLTLPRELGEGRDAPGLGIDPSRAARHVRRATTLAQRAAEVLLAIDRVARLAHRAVGVGRADGRCQAVFPSGGRRTERCRDDHCCDCELHGQPAIHGACHSQLRGHPRTCCAESARPLVKMGHIRASLGYIGSRSSTASSEARDDRSRCVVEDHDLVGECERESRARRIESSCRRQWVELQR